jgi:hypothetical protein
MEFNEKWTKEDNDILRNMNKEGKSIDEIISFFGQEKLSHHPKKKYSYSKLKGYHHFINEIKITPTFVDYEKKIKKSFYENEKNYIFIFNDYALILFYVINFNKPSYEIVFTTKDNYNIYSKTVKKIQNEQRLPTKDEDNYLSNLLEKETNNNEIYLLMKNISYILLQEYPVLKMAYNIPLSITETDNPIKIRLYRNIIQDSFNNYTETKNISELSKDKIIYYYE